MFGNTRDKIAIKWNTNFFSSALYWKQLNERILQNLYLSWKPAQSWMMIHLYSQWCINTYYFNDSSSSHSFNSFSRRITMLQYMRCYSIKTNRLQKELTDWISQWKLVSSWTFFTQIVCHNNKCNTFSSVGYVSVRQTQIYI